MPSNQSKMFDLCFLIFKIFGIWPGITPSKYYKYFSFVYIFVTFICYVILLTLNLLYTPPKVEILIREVMFYFTEVTVATKMMTLLFYRKKLIHALNLIDCDEFIGDYRNKDGILYKIFKRFKFGSIIYILIGNGAYSFEVIAPLLTNFIKGTKPELPISKYYFLSDEIRDSYFGFWFLYQSFSIYGHMLYNVTTDTLIAGLLIIAVAQLRLLNINLTNFKLSKEEHYQPRELIEKIQITRLNRLLKHYELILNYCETVQDILSLTLFSQLSMGSIMICVVTCGLHLPSSTEFRVFMVLYLSVMIFQIFLPGYLGSQLIHESQELVTAAYSSEWIPRSESFKRNLTLFIERAKTPIVISGLKMFPLSLFTFTSIMKSAYSFFTLIREVQEE